MSTRSASGFAFALALIITACTASPDETAEAPPAAPAGAEVLQLEHLRNTLTVAHEKFNGLAEAMPEESYAWRPMEGVRSVGDVFQHIAADNYFVPALMGVEPPAETGITADYQTFAAYQQRPMTKAEIVAALDASFDFMFESMDATADELDRTMMLGQSETTVGDVWIRAITHLHEHLGQSIAYARSNEVAPPWSM